MNESGFAQDMPRSHGYARRGERCCGIHDWRAKGCLEAIEQAGAGLECCGIHDWRAKGRVNALGAMTGCAFLTVDLCEGNINSDVFYTWTTQSLVPCAAERCGCCDG